MNDLIIFKSYFKTSLRNLGKNKLFATLNITGLAIAMVLSLLSITLIRELDTYDKFHAKSSRIYRLEDVWTGPDKNAYAYASTSLSAARKVEATVTGIEDMVILRKDLREDLRYGDKMIPMKGFWASESFFNVFSFKMINGNASTALNEPYSLVLTETFARKIFGETEAIGKSVQLDTINYTVTGVMEDAPMNSHLRFDALASFVTIDTHNLSNLDKNWLKWDNIWGTYVYLLLPQNTDPKSLNTSLARISAEGNRTVENTSIDLYLKPMEEIVFSRNMSNSIGPQIDSSIHSSFLIFGGIVILSACFNYTNLSIARALRRAREVGVRKVVGASARHVFSQFMIEAVLIAILSMVVSVGLFHLLRNEFVTLNGFQEMVNLQPEWTTYFVFVGLAVFVGIFAGMMPAIFFSRINTASVLKDFSSLKLFGHLKLRKALIVFQYTLSLLFIVSAILAYKQYNYSVNFDFGFQTGNVMEVGLEGNKSELVMKVFSELHEVKQISRSMQISSANSESSGYMRHKEAGDSSIVFYNYIDENYIPLHEHKLLAGRNFSSSAGLRTSEVIINEQALKWMKDSIPHQALGEEVTIDGKKLTVVGVIKDFNYDRVNYPIRNFVFMNDPQQFRFLNLKVESEDMVATMDKFESAWKKIDAVHPLNARFHEDYIRESYRKLAWMIKIFGFVAVLAISIASLGLLGMVVFTTETRLKEISIRKVMGASEGHLLILLGKGFISLLIISSCIAIPAAYMFFDKVAFSRIVYRVPIGFFDLVSGAVLVLILAVALIASQTIKTARCNPAEVLKNE
jgi:ABC-type antimicrobial peptide transport system permease subunit